MIRAGIFLRGKSKEERAKIGNTGNFAKYSQISQNSQNSQNHHKPTKKQTPKGRSTFGGFGLLLFYIGFVFIFIRQAFLGGRIPFASVAVNFNNALRRYLDESGLSVFLIFEINEL